MVIKQELHDKFFVSSDNLQDLRSESELLK